MLWVCKQDGVHYSVDSPACPQCGSTEHWDEGEVPTGEPIPVVEAVPDGPADKVLAWVGDDLDRAAAALTVEQAAAKPRSTLIDQLTKLAEQEEK